jgi:hypothetical protein
MQEKLEKPICLAFIKAPESSIWLTYAHLLISTHLMALMAVLQY